MVRAAQIPKTWHAPDARAAMATAAMLAPDLITSSTISTGCDRTSCETVNSFASPSASSAPPTLDSGLYDDLVLTLEIGFPVSLATVAASREPKETRVLSCPGTFRMTLAPRKRACLLMALQSSPARARPASSWGPACCRYRYLP